MSVLVAHLGEVVVEGRAGFSAQQLEQRLSELLSELPLEASGKVEIGELVIEAQLTLHAAAEAAARAIAERLARRQP